MRVPQIGGGAASPPVDVSEGGLAGVAAALSGAASALASASAIPLVHPPLAADEVSTSSAGRLTEHGAVLTSRATDGAAVLESAVKAVLAIWQSLSEVDASSIAALQLAGASGATSNWAGGGPAMKLDANPGEAPILPMAPRPGEATAALLEAGSRSAGSSFSTGCQAYELAFESCASAARMAQSAVNEAVTGSTGPQLSAALGKFASWADAMAQHSNVVAASAAAHGTRFENTQRGTPSTAQFTNTRSAMARAAALNMQTGGMYSGVVASLYDRMSQLEAKTTATAMGYHAGELPQAPPPPPRVTDITHSDSADQPGDQAESDERPLTLTGRTPGAGTRGAGENAPDPAGQASQNEPTPDGAGTGAGHGASTSTDAADPGPVPEAADDDLLGDLDPLGESGDPAQGMMPLAAMLPSMVAGTLGGAVGAAASIPQQLGQQVAGAAQQAMQGFTSGLQQPDLGLDGLDDPLNLGGLGSSAGSGGGGGGTVPAAGDTPLPNSGGGVLAAASAPPTPPPALPTSGGVTPPAPGAAGMGGGGMMMPPMMGGMGAGGGGASRSPAPPDKRVVTPSEANAAPVQGEVERRQTAAVAEGTPAGKSEATGPARRRVVVPASKEPEGGAGG